MIYWTNVYAQDPKIEAAWMTGFNRTTLASGRLGNPTGLTIDYYMNDRIYWCDSKENIIESINADGSYRKIIVSSGEETIMKY